MNPWGVYKGNKVTCDSPLLGFSFFFFAMFIIARDPVIALSVREVGRGPASRQNLLPGFGLSVVCLPFSALGLETHGEIEGSRKTWQQELTSRVTAET